MHLAFYFFLFIFFTLQKFTGEELVIYFSRGRRQHHLTAAAGDGRKELASCNRR